jgi:lipoate-protein ligase A
MTGGGSVFHDLGNLNFCFIMNNSGESHWNFETYTRPVLDVLQELGIDARLQGRNDLTIEGLKFSGNAKKVFKEKTLQHGTILFSSKMTDLSQALKANPLKFSDKSVKSIRARVTNVSDHLKQALSLEEFVDRIHSHVRSLYPQAQDYVFTEAERSEIQRLVDTKYASWDWNFGTSPQYNLCKGIRTKAGTIEFYLNVKNGRIASLKIFGDYFGKEDTEELSASYPDLPIRKSRFAKRSKSSILGPFSAKSKLRRSSRFILTTAFSC